jgi:hypothetical protein
MYSSTFFLTKHLLEVTSRSGSFTSGKRVSGTHWIGGWVDPRGGLDDLEKRKFLILPGLELRPLGRPLRSQSLYQWSPYICSTECTYKVRLFVSVEVNISWIFKDVPLNMAVNLNPVYFHRLINEDSKNWISTVMQFPQINMQASSWHIHFRQL